MQIKSHAQREESPARLKAPRSAQLSRRLATALCLAATLWISWACAAAPTIQQLVMQTATPTPGQSWAVAQIAKPSSTSVPAAATEPATAVSAPPTAAPEAITPETAPTAMVSLPSDDTADPPLITMEIVDTDPQPASNPEVVSPQSSSGKYILVSLSEQHLYAYDNGQLIYSFVASTGMGNSTRAGTFHVLDKIPNAYGANWNIWMPNWMGIYWSGTLENGIHALPILPGGGRLWAGYLGTPISYGCVVLGVDESQQLYDWADVGTTVEIRW